MSRAFTREPDGELPPEPLAETPVSPHRNLVTPRGLALLQMELARLDQALATLSNGDGTAGDRSDDAVDGHSRSAHLSRDRRYIARRIATAEPVVDVPAADGDRTVTFGCAVTLALANGRRVSWRIVGEDEAAPAHGRIAWTAPVAVLLQGLGVGDTVVLPAGPAEVVAIDPKPEPDRDPPVPETPNSDLPMVRPATGDPA